MSEPCNCTELLLSMHDSSLLARRSIMRAVVVSSGSIVEAPASQMKVDRLVFKCRRQNSAPAPAQPVARRSELHRLQPDSAYQRSPAIPSLLPPPRLAGSPVYKHTPRSHPSHSHTPPPASTTPIRQQRALSPILSALHRSSCPITVSSQSSTLCVLPAGFARCRRELMNMTPVMAPRTN